MPTHSLPDNEFTVEVTGRIIKYGFMKEYLTLTSVKELTITFTQNQSD